jgi:hypothetical protein
VRGGATQAGEGAMSYRDPTVPPLLYCDRCNAPREWTQRDGQFFCAVCATRNGLTVAADDKRREVAPKPKRARGGR